MDKEYYIKQIEKIADYLKKKADILFLDIREPISSVDININIEPAATPEIEITKKYYPMYAKDEKVK